MSTNSREQREQAKRAKRLRRLTAQAIIDYDMIGEGDRVMVCLSGGKDSWTLLDLLLGLQASAPVRFEIGAVHLDQKQPGYDPALIPGYLATRGLALELIEQDTYGVVTRVIPPGRTMCGLCSRLRRGALYRHARERGYTRIALGHHADDILETLFLNMFHGGRLKAMPPKLVSDDGQHVLIRPLAYCRQADIAAYARARGFPILPCNLCGSQQTLQRNAVAAMLADWQRRFPGRVENCLRALRHVVPSHLADRELFDFAALGTGPGRRPASAATWLGTQHRSDPDEAASTLQPNLASAD